MLQDFYLKEHEKSPQEAFARASLAWSKYKDELDSDLAERLYSYVSNKWFMFASPVLSNAPNGEVPKIRECLLVVSLPIMVTKKKIYTLLINIPIYVLVNIHLINH